MIHILLLLILAWFAASVGLLVLLNWRTLLAAWREPVLACPVLIVESDDWGPGPSEDAAALQELARVLESLRDDGGRSAVMTLGVVSAVPDGQAILDGGCTRYVRRTLADPAFTPVREAMQAGRERAVFAPQWHGLEHFWPDSLLACLDERADPAQRQALRDWLRADCPRSEDLPAALQSRWVDAARLPSSPVLASAVALAVREEAAVLRYVFGAVPEVAVPNTFVWDDVVERAWATCGVSCVVTPGCRYEGRDAMGGLASPTRRIRNGDRGQGDVCYAVRDVYFEPLRGHRAEDVWRALEERTAQGRATLLETHRSNFVGPLEVRDAVIAELERALRGSLTAHHDLRFMATAELAQILRDAESPFRERDLRLRVVAWLRRIAAEAGPARILKITGLGSVIRRAGNFLGGVNFRRSHYQADC
ncbi:MAG TPA: hypothetical protein VJ673_02240 [Aromatoleum sp.]|uniref:hypothetical protein n=1 Tax=Aromatoleum sp. TaxID=2307007 RepID=UPI002B48B5F1|nr:hypothetical protein [Aromatoleum sp.]HJV24470.1 hypothetical protein [Aromatoleum sp.]